MLRHAVAGGTMRGVERCGGFRRMEGCRWLDLSRANGAMCDVHLSKRSRGQQSSSCPDASEAWKDFSEFGKPRRASR